MNSNIVIVSCSRGNAEKTALYDSLSNYRSNECNYINEVVWFENNTRSISECYNEVISEYRSNNHKPIILFIHDDVTLDDFDFERKLIKYADEFDIMGVAGSTVINTKANVIAWHLSPPETLYGAVQHVDNGKYWMVNFSGHKRIPQRVACIDGLFIAMRPNAYEQIQFDERFEWDFYDMDLCVSAYKKELRVGVVPISVSHASNGSGINSDKYKLTQQLFLDKLHNE